MRPHRAPRPARVFNRLPVRCRPALRLLRGLGRVHAGRYEQVEPGATQGPPNLLPHLPPLEGVVVANRDRVPPDLGRVALKHRRRSGQPVRLGGKLGSRRRRLGLGEGKDQPRRPLGSARPASGPRRAGALSGGTSIPAVLYACGSAFMAPRERVGLRYGVHVGRRTCSRVFLKCRVRVRCPTGGHVVEYACVQPLARGGPGGNSPPSPQGVRVATVPRFLNARLRDGCPTGGHVVEYACVQGPREILQGGRAEGLCPPGFGARVCS